MANWKPLGEKELADSNDAKWTFINWVGIITPQAVYRVTLTPSRHLTDTLQTPHRHPKCSTFWPWEVTGRKGIMTTSNQLFMILWHLYSPRHLLDTPRYDPDTVGDPETPSRHSPDRHRRFCILEVTGRKGNIWVGMTFIHFYQQIWYQFLPRPYILKVDKLAESVFFASKNWRKKCVNRDKKIATKVRKLHKSGVFNNKLSK